jgi:hypothetical protein
MVLQMLHLARRKTRMNPVPESTVCGTCYPVIELGDAGEWIEPEESHSARGFRIRQENRTGANYHHLNCSEFEIPAYAVIPRRRIELVESSRLAFVHECSIASTRWYSDLQHLTGG